MVTLKQRLDEGDILVLDGATGTELERRGAPMSPGAWCALASEHAPQTLLEIHEDYIRAGADIITANTFSNARHMLELVDAGDRVADLTRRAVEIAQRARDRASRGRDVAVALSLSHLMPVIQGAARDDPALRPTPDVVFANLQEVVAAGCEAGVDLILLEMMSRPVHMELALKAAGESGLPFWCGLSARSVDGKIVSYVWEDYPFSDCVEVALKGRADVVGVMHTPVHATGPALDIVRRAWKGPMSAYPDSGFFRMPEWQFIDIIAPAELVAEARHWIARGVCALGGCCGLGLEHVEALAGLREDAGPQAP